MNEYRAGPDTAAAAADIDIDIDEMMVMVHADRLTTYDEWARARARITSNCPHPRYPQITGFALVVKSFSSWTCTLRVRKRRVRRV